MADLQDWTACQVHGHRFTLDGEVFTQCFDCNEPGDPDCSLCQTPCEACRPGGTGNLDDCGCGCACG